MNVTEFKAAVVADAIAREAARIAPKASCHIPDKATSEQMVACGCDDCMDRALGREVEEHPIGALRISRGI